MQVLEERERCDDIHNVSFQFSAMKSIQANHSSALHFTLGITFLAVGLLLLCMKPERRGYRLRDYRFIFRISALLFRFLQKLRRLFLNHFRKTPKQITNTENETYELSYISLDRVAQPDVRLHTLSQGDALLHYAEVKKQMRSNVTERQQEFIDDVDVDMRKSTCGDAARSECWNCGGQICNVS